MRSLLHTATICIITLFCHTQNLRAQDSLSDPRILNAVPVSKEPRHHDVLDNKWVRVLDVHLPAGDTSLFHKHETPSVFIVLSQTKTGAEALIEPPMPPLTNGNIWFEGFYDKPRVHRVWNSDTSEFHVMDIEIVNRDNQPMDSLGKDMPDKFSALLFNEKPATGFKLRLRPDSFLKLEGNTKPILVVNLEETGPKLMLNETPLVKKGDYLFLPENTPLQFANLRSTPADLVVIYLK